MRAWLRKNAFFLLLFSLNMLAAEAVHADNHQSRAVTIETNGIYPPYPVTAKAATPEAADLINKGEYLAKMGDCIACHTDVKSGTPSYAGGLEIKTPFGSFYSPNITPDKETGIGNWTAEDFVRAMKEGRDPNGNNYFPVFPYIYFTKITDALI